MSRISKFSFLFALFALATSSLWWNAVDAGKPKPVNCSIDVLVEFRPQNSTAVTRSVSYVQDFTVSEGVDFLEDFSTATRFRDFRATFSEVEGRAVVAVDWDADIGVLDFATFSTELTLEKGQKSGSVGATTRYFYSIPSATGGNGGTVTITYTLSGQRL